MGYTHYWTFHTKRGQAQADEKTYIETLKKCAKIVRHYSEKFGGLSGYTAHDETGRYGGLNVNGSSRVGDCEPFTMREHFSENDTANFCKTRQYPYDTVVVACLIVLHHYMPTQILVSSDGFRTDWADGLTLAQTVLKNKSLRIPDSIEERGYDKDAV